MLCGEERRCTIYVLDVVRREYRAVQLCGLWRSRLRAIAQRSAGARSFAGARVTSTRRAAPHAPKVVCVFVRRSLIAAWFSLGSLCLYLYVRRTVLYLRRRTVAKVTDHHLPDETGLPIRASHLRAACSAHHHRHPRPPPTANHRYHHRSGAAGSVPAR